MKWDKELWEDTHKKVWLLYDQYRSGNAMGGQGRKGGQQKGEGHAEWGGGEGGWEE